MVGSRHRFQRGLRSWLFEIALILVRADQLHRRRGSERQLSGCRIARSRVSLLLALFSTLLLSFADASGQHFERLISSETV